MNVMVDQHESLTGKIQDKGETNKEKWPFHESTILSI